MLQKFHDEGETGVQTKEQAVAALEESWVTAGYSSPEEAQEALAEGRELLEAYIESHLASAPEAKTLYVEKQLRKDMGEFVLMGRIDRIDELPDGRIEIVDYKSGRSDTDPNDLLNDIAMNCYHLLLREFMPGKRMLSTIVAVRTGSRTTVEPTPDHLESFRQDIIALGAEILHRDWESLTPVWKDICPECDFIELCKKHPAFVESAGGSLPKEDF